MDPGQANSRFLSDVGTVVTEKPECIEPDCTYACGQFAAFLYSDQMFIDKKGYLIEQYCEGIKEYDRTRDCLKTRMWRRIISTGERNVAAAKVQEVPEHPVREGTGRLRNNALPSFE